MHRKSESDACFCSGRGTGVRSRVFGYREDDALIYVPLYKQSLSILNVKGWILAGGEPFYNGRFGGAK